MEYYQWTIRIPKQPLKLIRFRISTILLLTAIVALVLAWRRDHKQLLTQLYRFQNPTSDWSTSQATGPPNTTGSGDIRTAWASATPDDSKEWLELEYDESVVPTAILVHETYNPGALVKVTHVSYWGNETTLWEGTDPTSVNAGAGVSRIPISASFKTGRIKLYIDSPAVPGYNEIDAVGIEDANKKVIWASKAKASSAWGSGMSGSPNIMWSYGLQR
jgi:hypothetical protein